MTVLFAWLGNTDLRASEGDASATDGPILSALRSRRFSQIQLLSDYSRQKAAAYATWLTKHSTCPVEILNVKLSSPTDFTDIYRRAKAALDASRAKSPKQKFAYHLSPGTPAMAAVWILISKTVHPAELIESSRERGLATVSFPFDLAAEFMPEAGKLADESLEKLMQGLPPEAPEFASIMHRCGSMKKVVAMARRLAQRDVSVLIQGESGTGKELFARAIHQSSARKGGPFIAVNCGAIPIDLVDSELFGHEKGAFTGASVARAGYFEAAEGGTLFLDEIGELPRASQVRLLRVLQEREVTRVGATQARKINVRVVAATNRVLPLEVKEGRFREDLFHRLAVGVLVLPPVREREGDVALLIDSLLDDINREASNQIGHKNKKISVKARNIIIRHSWPGNVRELYNTLLRASIWASDSEISADDVREAMAISVPPASDVVLGKPLDHGFSLSETMSTVAQHYLERAVAQSHGSKTEAARLLGLGSYQTLTNWLEKYEVGK